MASTARFKVVAAGRRFGKTKFGAVMCVITALKGKRAWWVAPSYAGSLIGWREIMDLVAPLIERGLVTHISKSDYIITFKSGGYIQIKSAALPDNLRGEGLDLVVIDEAAFVKEAVWFNALRPALSDRNGQALLISSPAGKNWFYHLWTRGQDSEFAGQYESWKFKTAVNPLIPASELYEAERTQPARIFEQEYLGEFIDDGGEVFRNVMECATAGGMESGGPRKKYAYGIDWGKLYDFTVITVWDIETGEMVAFDRYNKVDYALQTGRIYSLTEKFKPYKILAESNSMGEPLIEDLVRKGLPVQGFNMNNSSKAIVVEQAALAFEQKIISILPVRELINELQAFTQDRTAGGLTRYHAPEGMHDDTVVSLCLGYHLVAQTLKRKPSTVHPGSMTKVSTWKPVSV